MNIANPSKALIAFAALVCLTILMVAGSIESSEGLPVLTAIVGYSIGNGIAAAQGQPVTPIIGRKSKA